MVRKSNKQTAIKIAITSISLGGMEIKNLYARFQEERKLKIEEKS